MEDSLSSTNHKISRTNSSDFGLQSCSSEDSSWSLYFDSSVEDTVTCSGSLSSSVYSGVDPAVKKLNSFDDRFALANSVAKRRKVREIFVDHDLEDTATSPVCNSETQELEQMHIKFRKTSNVMNMSSPTRLNKHNCGSFLQGKRNTSSKTGELLHCDFTREDMNYAGLREKGLCLVPVSSLFKVPVSFLPGVGLFSNSLEDAKHFSRTKTCEKAEGPLKTTSLFYEDWIRIA